MKRFELFFMVLQVPCDFFLLLAAAMSAYVFRFSPFVVAWKPVLFSLTFADFIFLSIFVAFVFLFFFACLGLYTPNQNRAFAHDIGRLFIGCLSGLSFVAIYILFTQQLFDSRFLVLVSVCFGFVFVVLGRLILRLCKWIFYRYRIGLRRVAVIGKGTMAEQVVQVLRERPALGYDVLFHFDVFHKKNKASIVNASLDELLLVDPTYSREDMVALIHFCYEHHIVFKYAADVFSSYASHSIMRPLAGIPIVELQRTPLDGWGRVVKRIYDVVFSLVFLIVCSPLYLLISCVILLETGRPIWYMNERVGVQGKHFFTYKFRSMYQKDCTGPQFGSNGKRAEKKEQSLISTRNTRQGPIYKIADDPRVTPFGAFLRRWSIDEFPQFVNVLIGNMSLVGPRPHQPREVSGYVQEHKKVFAVKPGITGLAQISGRSDLSYEDEVRLDVFYIERWSVFLDMIILLKTPFVLLKKRKVW